jgi:peptide/nickel transport system substrate-binding protein
VPQLDEPGVPYPNRLTRRRLLTRSAQASAASYALLRAAPALARGEATRGGTLRLGVAAGITDADPHTSTYLTDGKLLEDVYRGLTILDTKTKQPVGEIAKSWKVSKDQLTWTFFLRPNAKFHNGRQVTADDVKFSIERILDPKTKATAASDLEPVASVVAVDKLTVRMKLKRPYSILPIALQLPLWAAIVPKEAVATLRDKPVGTGPYQFVSQVPKTSLTLERFADYWDPSLPYLDRLEFKVIPDENAKLQALLSNQVDFIDTVPMARAATLLKSPPSGARIVLFKTSWVNELGFNCKQKPFDDVRVRQAIAMAIDKREVAKAATFGLGGPMDTMVSPASPIPVRVKSLPYNPSKAKDLLKAAGVSKVDLPFSPCGGTAYPDMLRAGEVIANELQKIDVNAKVSTMEGGLWADSVVTKHNYSGFVCGLVNGNDPDGHTYRYFHTNAAYDFSQYGGTAVLDRYLDVGRQTTNVARRRAVYTAAWKILAHDVPWIPLYWVPGLVGMRTNVHGFRPMPEFNLRFAYMWMSK